MAAAYARLLLCGVRRFRSPRRASTGLASRSRFGTRAYWSFGLSTARSPLVSETLRWAFAHLLPTGKLSGVSVSAGRDLRLLLAPNPDFQEKEKGTKPMISEVVRKLCSKDKDGTELGPGPATFVVEFERLVAENPSSESISINKQMELWLIAIKGLRNGWVFGLGEVGVIDNLNDISCLSTIHTQEHMEPFKEEIREVRDEMKTL